MKGFITHHISIPPEDSELFRHLKEKTRSRSYGATLTAALRALEEKEAAREKMVREG